MPQPDATPPTHYEKRWQDKLERLAEKNLRRQLKRSDPPGESGSAINMATNNYLGLAGDERLAQAAADAAEEFGVGAGASRLVTGNLGPHVLLEQDIARYKNAEAALVFTSGYAANVGVLSALAGPRDVVFADRLSHASLIDGARQSGAKVRLYTHNDTDRLSEMLSANDTRGQQLIITDGVFSMDGDLAPLPDLVAVARDHDALLLLDDAHATGVLGPEGRGTAAHFGLEEHVPIRIGTLSKALGVQGGFVVGSKTLIDLLVNEARSFIYSTGIAPPLAAAARKALEIAASENSGREQVRRHVQRLRQALQTKGYTVLGEEPAPLLAVQVGEAEDALRLAASLGQEGIIAPAIRPPTVPEGTSRIRLAPMATHTDEEMQRVIRAFPKREEEVAAKN